MIDNRADSIIYQSQVYFSDLIDDLVDKKRLGKALDSKWTKADRILELLEAYSQLDNLTDTDDITGSNYILYCLIELCELNQYPVGTPITPQSVPAVYVGQRGPKGEKGDTGERGEAGLATDFQVSLISVPTIVDSFDITDAKGARWDYVVIQSTGEQRSGSVIGTWSADGAQIEFNDISTADIQGSTTPLEFDVIYNAGDIQFTAIPASGQWQVVGTRYFIPNNGNGTGPVSNVLADGLILIGNSSNTAQARAVSGVINITNTGVTSFTSTAADSIINIINNSSSGSVQIQLSNLAPLPTHNRVLISSNTGVITESGITTTTLNFLDATSSIQTQLTSKLTDPMTTSGDIIRRNGSNVTSRLGIGSNGQVLTVSGGLPIWQTPAIPTFPFTPVEQGGGSGMFDNKVYLGWSGGGLLGQVDATPLGEIIFSNNVNTSLEYSIGIHKIQLPNNYLAIQSPDGTIRYRSRLSIGAWNMDTDATKAVAHGVGDATKIRILQVMIIRDDAARWSPLTPGFSSTASGYYDNWDNTNIYLSRLAGGEYDNTNYDAGGNRGYIDIEYTP